MKELKIFGIVAVFTLVLYWGVEPFAHSQMHKHVEGHGFVYDGKADIEAAKEAKKEDVVKTKEAFWANVATISKLKGDATAVKRHFQHVWVVTWKAHQTWVV